MTDLVEMSSSRQSVEFFRVFRVLRSMSKENSRSLQALLDQYRERNSRNQARPQSTLCHHRRGQSDQQPGDHPARRKDQKSAEHFEKIPRRRFQRMARRHLWQSTNPLQFFAVLRTSTRPFPNLSTPNSMRCRDKPSTA